MMLKGPTEKVLHEILVNAPLLVKIFVAFYETQMFVAMCKTSRSLRLTNGIHTLTPL